MSEQDDMFDLDDYLKKAPRSIWKKWQWLLGDYHDAMLVRDRYYEEKKNFSEEILKIIKEIQAEIDSRKKYPNMGKKGCVKRLESLLIKTLK